MRCVILPGHRSAELRHTIAQEHRATLEKTQSLTVVRNSLIVIAAWSMLAAVFLVDVCTPQDLVAAILLDVPIVLAALTRSRRLIMSLVIVALICDVIAGMINARADHGHWDVIGICNRLLSAFSIALVGYLSTAVQDRARRVGVIMARESRMRREVSLAAAIERLRTLLSRELVERALVREAALLFQVDGVSWISSSRDVPMLTINGNDLDTIDERAAEGAELTSLVHSVLDESAPRIITRADALSRLLLARFNRTSAVALAVREGQTPYGILMLWSNAENVFEDDDEMVTARVFARALATALGRAELFAELARRNEEIAERSAIIRDLVYALTHDLRTPLTALGVTMRQARDRSYGELPERYERILDASISAIDDLQRLAETLLTVARIESGELRNTRDAILLHNVLADVVTEFSALAESRDVRISIGSDIEATILGDRGDIRRAVTNLVANALEHTPKHGNVELRLEKRAGSVLVHVSDDGYGIPLELQSMLFERFTSLTSSAGRGTGLGLYIVRRIAEAANGSVSYTCKEPRGSTFTLCFPSAGTT